MIGSVAALPGQTPVQLLSMAAVDSSVHTSLWVPSTSFDTLLMFVARWVDHPPMNVADAVVYVADRTPTPLPSFTFLVHCNRAIIAWLQDLRRLFEHAPAQLHTIPSPLALLFGAASAAAGTMLGKTGVELQSETKEILCRARLQLGVVGPNQSHTILELVGRGVTFSLHWVVGMLPALV